MSPSRPGPALDLVNAAHPMVGTLGRPEAPKYIRVRDWLMEHILSSGFARGEKLPSESDLVRRFDVSRVTVRQALEALRAEGFIESRHGKGWFLRQICAVQNLGRLQGFGEMLAPMGVKVRSKVLDVKECADPEGGGEGLRPAGKRERDPDRAAADRRRTGDVLRSQLLPARHRPAAARAGSVAPGYFRAARARARHAARLRRRHDRDRAGGRRAGAAAWREAGDADLQDDAPHHDLRGFPIDFEYVYGLPESHLFKVRVPRR